MKALVAYPSTQNSPKLIEFAGEPVRESQLQVEMLCVGICGTDREILGGKYGQAPEGSDFLILGHESLGKVIYAPPNCGFEKGDHVVGIVRHPDPDPCPNCAIGEWDMCRNGRYTEHGIKGLHGFCRERYALDPHHAVKVDSKLGELGVLLEPASVLAKAWEHVERIGSRALFTPRRALVMGAGPVGLLAALMGRQRNLEVWVLDRAEETKKAELVKGIGAHFVSNLDDLPADSTIFDVVMECTGAPSLVLESMKRIGAGGVSCLTGVSSGGRMIQLDAGSLGREIVLENGAIFGSVNANKRHYEKGAEALAAADRSWLAEFITTRASLENWPGAIEKRSGGIKAIITGPAWQR
jgi:threonine dehydrogenase-like Zn-dependent dehydrogenase